MRIPVLITSGFISLFLIACGGEKSEPLIDVNEKKYAETHPDNAVSGDVEVAKQDFTVKLEVPSPAWSVAIQSVWTVGDQNWVIARLSQDTSGPAAQTITEVSDTVTVTAPNIAKVYYILGKTYGWDSEDPAIQYIDSLADIQTGLQTGTQIWPEQK